MTREEILKKLAENKLTVEEAAEQLAKLIAAPHAAGKLLCKVSRKGAVSLYGLQRMPVTLYVEQWERLFAFAKEFEAFVKKWEGKDFKGLSATKQGGEKEAYTARITRKAA